MSNFNTHSIASSCICCGKSKLTRTPAILCPFVAHRALLNAPVEIREDWGLKDIKHGWAHTICNTLYCSSCDFMFLDLRFSDSEVERLYHNYRGSEYVALREFYEPGYAERQKRLNHSNYHLQQVEIFLAPFINDYKKILDWGGDQGINTPLKDLFDEVHIFDISSKSVLPGIKKVSKAEAQKHCYSALICSNVIEHVPFPAEVLQDIRECMDPGSVFYIELPFEKTMQKMPKDRDQKRHWHEHINFFSKQAITNLLPTVGFSVIKIQDTLVAPEGSDSYKIIQVAAKKR